VNIKRFTTRAGLENEDWSHNKENERSVRAGGGRLTEKTGKVLLVATFSSTTNLSHIYHHP